MSAQGGRLRAVALPLLGLIGAAASLAQGPGPLPVSKGVYRLPYADGTTVQFLNDHTNHPALLNRIDMAGMGSGPFTVVAAAAGTIRLIIENRDTTCPNANNDPDGDGNVTTAENQAAQNSACGGYSGPATFCCERDFEANGGTCPGGFILTPLGIVSPTCQSPNNFVWIEHPNGEWMKYTHMQRGSIGPTTDNNGNPGAGRFIGEFVQAGAVLGIEGDVGIATSPHLHLEVGVPNFVDNGTVADWFNNGFLVGDGVQDDVLFEDSDGDGVNDPDDDVNRQNRIPIFCNVGFTDAVCALFPLVCLFEWAMPAVGGSAWTAAPCDDLCLEDSSEVAGTISAGSIFYRQATDSVGNAGNDFVVEANAGAALRAGSSVTLSPGFHAEQDSYFSASIGACDSPGGDD